MARESVHYNPRGAIVYVTPYFPPYGAGGAERTCSLHARLLAESGRRVIVITPEYGPQSLAAPGVEVRRFPLTELKKPGQQADEDHLLSTEFGRRLADECARLLAGEEIACLHSQNSHTVIGTGLAADALGLPLITHLRDTTGICIQGAICLVSENRNSPPRMCGALQNYDCSRRLVRRTSVVSLAHPRRLYRELRAIGQVREHYARLDLRRNYYRKSRRIAFSSRGLIELYAAVTDFVRPERARVVYNPVLPGDEIENRVRAVSPGVQAIYADGKSYMLYAGKVSRGKGADVLFEAHRRLLESMPDVWLVVAGNVHGDWNYVRERTLFSGFLEQHELGALYARAAVAVAPSTWPEPLGWAGLDAGRFSIPAVGSRVGGIPEVIVDGETGFLVERKNPVALADAVKRVLGDPQAAAEMGRRACTTVKDRFGAAAVTRLLHDLYANLDQD